MSGFSFRRKPPAELSEGQLRAAGRIAGRILSAQRQLADYLNRVTRRISPKRWLVLLSGFGLLWGAYLLYLLAQVFN